MINVTEIGSGKYKCQSIWLTLVPVQSFVVVLFGIWMLIYWYLQGVEI
jgi:hypothetical protein